MSKKPREFEGDIIRNCPSSLDGIHVVKHAPPSTKEEFSYGIS